jgi:hypothetical protein
MKIRTVALAAGTLLLAATTIAPAAEVTVEGAHLLVDGRPFVVRGAAGGERLETLRALGANTVRSYGGDPGALLAAAAHANLKVIVGLWLEHPRRGFDYRNRAAVDAQLAAFRAVVERYRTSPALLAWGIGNEVEAELADTAPVWPAIEEAARLVKSLDPHHPTMAVLQELGTDKAGKIKALAPSIDVLGVNSYGDALPSVPARARAQGWTGPLVISEMGALGQWQAGHSLWNAVIEPTSTEKAARLRRYIAALNNTDAGQILFLWGHKQEVTPTWHSMLLADGDWQESAEVMAVAWGGKTPGANHAPRISALHLMPGSVLEHGAPARAVLGAHDPDGDKLTVEWRVLAESTDLQKAGDAENVPPDHSNALRDADSHGVRVEGLAPGNYRLFAYVRDSRGAAATANLPFQVC